MLNDIDDLQDVMVELSHQLKMSNQKVRELEDIIIEFGHAMYQADTSYPNPVISRHTYERILKKLRSIDA